MRIGEDAEAIRSQTQINNRLGLTMRLGSTSISSPTWSLRPRAPTIRSSLRCCRAAMRLASRSSPASRRSGSSSQNRKRSGESGWRWLNRRRSVRNSSCCDGLPMAASPFREIVRQQWNFSPTGSTHEMEDYRVDLSDAIADRAEYRPGYQWRGGSTPRSLGLLFA